MSDKTRHQINVVLMCFMIFVFLLLCVLQFVFALLWALLCALVIAMLARRNHPMYRVEKEIWDARVKKFKDARARKKREADQENRYQNEFVPDRMLVGIGDHAGKKYFIDKEIFVIGTKKSCQCVLGDRQASTISGEHCRITYRKHSRTYYIEVFYRIFHPGLTVFTLHNTKGYGFSFTHALGTLVYQQKIDTVFLGIGINSVTVTVNIPLITMKENNKGGPILPVVISSVKL